MIAVFWNADVVGDRGRRLSRNERHDGDGTAEGEKEKEKDSRRFQGCLYRLEGLQSKIIGSSMSIDSQVKMT